MRRVIPRFFKLAVPLGITGLFAIGYPADVQAQTIFCPAAFGITDPLRPVALANGSCTDGSSGAFSGAALASQSLSELSQTTTEVTTKEIGKSIVERREQERERCPAGFSRVDGACRPTRPPVPEPARAVPREKPNSGRGRQGASTASFADRTCRPVWDLGASLWRLSEEGRCRACHPKLLHGNPREPSHPF